MGLVRMALRNPHAVVVMGLFRRGDHYRGLLGRGVGAGFLGVEVDVQVVQAAERLAEQSDAAAAAEVGVDDGDVLVAHRLGELAAERRRPDAALGADEEEEGLPGHVT